MNDHTNEKPTGGTVSGADGELIRLAPVDDEFAATGRGTPVVAPVPPAPASAEPADTKADDPEKAAGGAPKSVAREYFESMIVTFIMALFGMTFITQAVKVPTGSMLNTILVEDHLMVNKFIFGQHPGFLGALLPYREIRRGDIIVFKYPENPEQNYVKRVIGLPGETIEVDGSRVYINGKELPENKVTVVDPLGQRDLEPVGQPKTAEGAQWTAYHSSMRKSAEDDDDGEDAFLVSDRGDYGVRAPFLIPEDSYFVMGDNRENSEDSRVWGVVPRGHVVGRAMFVYWSLKQYEANMDPGSNVIQNILEHTRWDRTGTLIK